MSSKMYAVDEKGKKRYFGPIIYITIEPDGKLRGDVLTSYDELGKRQKQRVIKLLRSRATQLEEELES